MVPVVSTIVAVICIAALIAGIVLYLWKSKDNNLPSYMKPQKTAKPSKEDKAVEKQNKKAEKAAKKAK